MVKEASPPFQNCTNLAMTGTSTVTSLPTNILYRDSVGVELAWTGTPTGTFQVQGSNSYNPGNPQSGGAPNAGNWTPIYAVDQNNNPPVAAGAPGTILMNLSQLAFAWIRISYTNSSGTGVLNGYITAKSFG